VITYGSEAATHTLDIYEDMRCPYCATLERALGPSLRGLADQGTVKLRYHVANFLDRGNTEGGSTGALAALGAARRHSAENVIALHTTILENLPETGSSQAFADPQILLGLAAKAPGVRNAEFDQAVVDGAYHDWALEAGPAAYEALKAAWSESGRTDQCGVPAVFLDGRFLDLMDDFDTVSPEQLADLVTENLA
jgi:protein-disulfide isomerase